MLKKTNVIQNETSWLYANCLPSWSITGPSFLGGKAALGITSVSLKVAVLAYDQGICQEFP